MIILGLDVATNTGWALVDPEKPQATLCGAWPMGIKDVQKLKIPGMEIRRRLRRKIDDLLCELIDKHRPDLAIIEQPLNYIEGTQQRRPKKGTLLKLPGDDDEGRGGPNANTAFLLNQLFAAADVVCYHKVAYIYEVAPKSWQTITKKMPGKTTKDRSIALCHTLKIPMPALNKVLLGDAADAVCIALYGAQLDQKHRRRAML